MSNYEIDFWWWIHILHFLLLAWFFFFHIEFWTICPSNGTSLLSWYPCVQWSTSHGSLLTRLIVTYFYTEYTPHFYWHNQTPWDICLFERLVSSGVTRPTSDFSCIKIRLKMPLLSTKFPNKSLNLFHGVAWYSLSWKI